MWPFKKRDGLSKKQVDPITACALIFSATALMVSIGVARWSWLILDEQIRLRKEFVELKNEQAQSNIQYEHWLGKLKNERAEWQKMNEKTGP